MSISWVQEMIFLFSKNYSVAKDVKKVQSGAKKKTHAHISLCCRGMFWDSKKAPELCIAAVIIALNSIKTA